VVTGFEVGAVVTGTVSAIPRPGAIGLFVDLDGERQGFVDVLILPRRPESWPAVGTKTTFEVLAHRPGQVRLWPLAPEFRSGPLDNGVSEAEWRARKARYPEGAVLTAEVSDVFAGSYLVRYEGGWSVLEDDGEPPEAGTRAVYQVVRHLDTTRRTLLRPGT
jgi:hypothetical protein